MQLHVSPGDAQSVISVDGEFLGGLHGAEFTRAVTELRRTGHDKIVLDLRSCTLMDSAGLGALIEAAGALRASGGDLRVVAREGRLRRLFEMTGLLGRVFAMFESLADAQASWNAEEADGGTALG